MPFKDPAVRVIQGWYYIRSSNANSLACSFPTGDLSGYRRHCGLDFVKRVSGKGNVSFPVYAAAGGVVTKSYARDTGTMVTILHSAAAPGGQRFCTRYLHLNSSRVNVRSGQTVGAGQQIAWSGNSGTGTIHLHFDVKVGGCGGAYPRVDPFDIAGKLIKARTAPTKDYYPQNSRFSGCGANSLVKSCSLR